MVDGTKIVITTLQKFSFVLRGLLHVAGAENTDAPDAASIEKAKEWEEKIAARNHAVIVDEAHSSQTEETARELKRMLGAGTEQGTEDADTDWEDGLNRIMESRGKQKNFFLHSPPPQKEKRLSCSGALAHQANRRPFHTYPMRQAIEEGFILDVLTRYTTYKTYFKLVKKYHDNPSMPKKRAAKKLAKFLVLHPVNIEQRTEIIIEHFREHAKHILNGRAKAMVVTGSRLHAVKYMQSFQKYIAENKYTDIRPMVAFSGTVKTRKLGLNLPSRD